MRKRIFVYDVSKGFSSFIKHYYDEKMEIDICTKKKNLANYKLSSYDFCFFSVNDIDDFLFLRNTDFSNDLFFINAPNKIINEKIYNLNFNNAVLFDFDSSKKNIIEKINFTFKLKNV
jgi:hypothetical protein